MSYSSLQMITSLYLLVLFLSSCHAFAPARHYNSDNSLSLVKMTAATTESETTTQQQQEDEVLQVQVVDSMPDPLPDTLNNNYFLLRHGQSTANVAEVISSSRSLAYSKKHGLTAVGYQQGFDSAEKLLAALKAKDDNKNKKVVFVSSPFARAKETAEACLDGLQQLEAAEWDISSEIILKERLMERYFGRLDDEAIYTYAYVWPLDKFNVTHTAFDVESVAAVCTRLRELIVNDLELTYTDSNIVLVSHADVLQICQLYAAGAKNVGIFSSYRFTNGEVRSMDRNEDSLPEPVPLKPPNRGTSSNQPMGS